MDLVEKQLLEMLTDTKLVQGFDGACFPCKLFFAAVRMQKLCVLPIQHSLSEVEDILEIRLVCFTSRDMWKEVTQIQMAKTKWTSFTQRQRHLGNSCSPLVRTRALWLECVEKTVCL